MNPKLRVCFLIAIVLWMFFCGLSWADKTGTRGLTKEDVEALRRKGEMEGWTFTVGENPATQYDLEELCGLVVPEDWWVGARFDPCTPRKDLPSRFDWRDSSGCTPVKNQGGCGSCWAFATVGPLECNIKIRNGVTVDLSEQWLVSCNQDGWGCGGGWFAHDYHEWKMDPCGGTGAVLEADFPYVAWNAPCDCPYPHEYLINDWAFIGGGGMPPVNSIKQAIMDYGPVSCCVYVNSAFQGYTGGIFNGCETGDCNHAVCLVGWDDNQGSEGVWFLRNSWGSGWGEGGYMRIPYECSIVGYAACYVDYRGYPQVVVTYPNGGEILTGSVTITWVATDPDPGQTELLDIDLEYSPDAGATWTVIDSNQTNDSSYLWDISTLPEGYNYLIRVTATDPTSVSDADTSDTTFTISKLLPDPAWTAEGDQEWAFFGWSLAGAGDVDGDGYGDVLVGASGYSNGQEMEGGAFLYAGSASGLSSVPSWTAENDSAYSYFGTSVDWAGDVNGDGYSDLMVGAEGYGNGEMEEGAAYVFLGGPSGPSASPDWMAESDAAGAHFGFSVSGAGDVNGDGYSDVIVGAPYYDVTGYDEGRAYLYLGGPAGPSTTPAWTVEGDQNGANLGYSISSAGDVNGDGYSDVVVGAAGYNDGVEVDVGQAYLYLGGPSGPSAFPDWAVMGDDDNASFGWSVSTAGDVNADGYSDVLVGAPGYTHNWLGEGRSYMYLGGPGGLADTTAWIGEGEQQAAEYGYSVAGVGDVNGDGYCDVIVGAESYDDGEIDEGCAVLYLGRASSPLLVEAWRAQPDQASAYFGSCVAGAGDVDGDGYGEVLVGSYLYDDPQEDEGQSYLFPGGSVPGMLPFRPRQARADGASLIGPLGASDSQTQVRLQVTGWYPGGSDSVKLQWEVKPLGTNFDSTGLGEGVSWVLADSSTGVELDELVTGLTQDTPYHWRARVLYRPGNPLGLDHSIWLSPSHNAWNEADFRTSDGGGGPPSPVDDLVATLVAGAKSSSGDLLLTWTEPYAESGVSYYVIYRSTIPAETGDSLAVTADTAYTDSGVVGDTLTHHYYTVKAVDSEGRKSAPSNQVGEFDKAFISSE